MMYHFHPFPRHNEGQDEICALSLRFSFLNLLEANEMACSSMI